MSDFSQMPPPPPPPPPGTPGVVPKPPAPQTPQFDFVKCFAYVFEDPRWLNKVLIGGLWYLAMFVLIGIPFVLGYYARVIRNVIAESPAPLPEWDDLGEFFSEGLRLFAAGIAYAIPMVIVYAGLYIPGILASASDSESARNIGGGFMACGMCLGFPIALVIGLLAPVAMLRVVVTGRIGAAFEFGQIWAFVRGNFINYLLAIVVHFVANFASQFGLILCLIGIVFTAFWSMLVSAHALGQAWRLSPVK
ncbi:MAG TPA: DUF4013 domain-containing protein [Thermoanaerobaculia bacterium]|nr:DUF4013 domain-containing protein [Thermoanaerobaculia bacterium]